MLQYLSTSFSSLSMFDRSSDVGHAIKTIPVIKRIILHGTANIHIPCINIYIPSMTMDQHFTQKHPNKELSDSNDLFLSCIVLCFLYVMNNTFLLITQLVLSPSLDLCPKEIIPLSLEIRATHHIFNVSNTSSICPCRFEVIFLTKCRKIFVLEMPKYSLCNIGTERRHQNIRSRLLYATQQLS